MGSVTQPSSSGRAAGGCIAPLQTEESSRSFGELSVLFSSWRVLWEFARFPVSSGDKESRETAANSLCSQNPAHLGKGCWGRKVGLWGRAHGSCSRSSLGWSLSFLLNGMNCLGKRKGCRKEDEWWNSDVWSLGLTYTTVCDTGEGSGSPRQSSCLENPMDGGAWGAAVHGITKSRTPLSDFTFTFHFHALEKAMATPSRVLAWRIPGTGKPGGLPSMGSHRVGHGWSDLAAAAAACDTGN